MSDIDDPMEENVRLREQIKKLSQRIHNQRVALTNRIKELEEKQKWIDEVARPAHPDDERPWCAAYLDEKKRGDALQAQIDSLMLEYCPDEMTDEQIEIWGRNQKQVEV